MANVSVGKGQPGKLLHTQQMARGLGNPLSWLLFLMQMGSAVRSLLSNSTLHPQHTVCLRSCAHDCMLVEWRRLVLMVSLPATATNSMTFILKIQEGIRVSRARTLRVRNEHVHREGGCGAEGEWHAPVPGGRARAASPTPAQSAGPARAAASGGPPPLSAAGPPAPVRRQGCSEAPGSVTRGPRLGAPYAQSLAARAVPAGAGRWGARRPRPLRAAPRWAWYLQVQLHQAGLPLGQGRLQDAVVLPQGCVRLSKARQLPTLVLQLQSQLLVRLLKALDVPVKAPRFLKLKQIPERSWLVVPPLPDPGQLTLSVPQHWLASGPEPTALLMGRASPSWHLGICNQSLRPGSGC